MSQQTYPGPLRPTIKAHGEYLGNLEQRTRAQRTLAGKYSLERAQVGAARVLELVPSQIDWFESQYGEWLATGADAVWGYSDAPPQSSSSGPLRPTIKAHRDYVSQLGQRALAQEILDDYSLEEAKASAARVLEPLSRRIDWFESKYGEWLATGAEAVWGYLYAPLPGLPEMP